jgi:DNA polymerase III alpha subunit (gram-positive type)
MILVYDTETTGLTLHPNAPMRKQPKMIEFGGVLLGRSGEIVEEYNVLVHPGEDVSPEITKITGITNDMLDAQSKTGLSLEQLAELMQVKGWMTIKADWVSRVLEQAKQQNQGNQAKQGQSLTDIIWGWEE